MRFKKDQRITYRNGEKGTILTTERKHPKYPVVSITDEGDIWTHTLSGKVNPVDDNPYDIMPPVPQGKDLVGELKAHIERLREHVELCFKLHGNGLIAPPDWSEEVLNETPAQSLTEIKNQVREDCAIICDNYEAENCAEAIRESKEWKY